MGRNTGWSQKLMNLDGFLDAAGEFSDSVVSGSAKTLASMAQENES